jgi:formate transporter
MQMKDDKAPGIPTMPSIDAHAPAEMAHKSMLAGVRKAQMRALPLFALAVLAGGFIGLGAVFATVAGTTVPGSEAALPWGATRLLMGVAFSLGLILVIVGGAELFTGNVLLVIGWAARRVSVLAVVRNWTIVYAGNLVGALGLAGMVFLSGAWNAGGGGVGLTALRIAQGKGHLGFGEALVLGILCNILVCLAVWLTFSARTTTDRILAIVPPVAAFVAAGFEHSIANMYFMPVAVLIRTFAPATFWTTVGGEADAFADVTWTAFVGNLVPVTIGNAIGGGLFVGAVYWLVYVRQEPPATIAER